MIGFETAVGESWLRLTNGGIEMDALLPEYIQVTALVDDPAAGPVLRRNYVSYVAAAHPFGLPVIIGTPTFRTSLNFVRRAGLGDAVHPRPSRRISALAMGETGLPHVDSFVLDGDGGVLDDTLLHAAIECIDAAASRRPMFYSISCVHPSTVARALRDERAFSDLDARRLVGFKANALALSTEELVWLDHPEGDDPENFAGGMWGIHEEFGLRILGGCCGTGDR